MKILFVTNEIFLSEPIGLLILSAVLKKSGHSTKLVSLKKHKFTRILENYSPDVVAYGAMTPDMNLMKMADKIVLKWIQDTGKKAIRIMGGPHPTFFPEILNEMKLDAICVGEGENAIAEIARRFENGRDFKGIPNIIHPGGCLENMEKELINDLDSLPFADRDVFYEAEPLLKEFALRGILTSRGCPYNCTYCFNHAYNKMFSGCGKILRRRSIESVLEEIRTVIKNYPKVKMLRFADDTFLHKLGPWENEFLDRYKKEINLPFYCLMRSNTLSEEAAKKLKEAGCISMAMALESGNEKIRNDILKRGLKDEVVKGSFAIAHKYGIRTYGNAILGIPGTTLKDDLDSIRFMKEIKMTSPTFTVFSPFPKTELTEYGVKNGFLDNNLKEINDYFQPAKLKNMTPGERQQQINIVYLGPLFCWLPWPFFPLIKIFSKLQITFLYRSIQMFVVVISNGLFIFPWIYPLNPFKLLKLLKEALSHWTSKEELIE